METITSALPTLVPSTSLKHGRPVFPAGARSSRHHLQKKMPGRVQSASRDDTGHHHDHNGEMVDKNMMVLRRRIKELRSSETSNEPPSSNQAEHRHAACVYQAVGLLQLAFMSIRPAVGIAIAAMVALSLPMTAIFILLHSVGWGNS